MSDQINNEILELLNTIYRTELAGVVRYTHYSLMLMGPHRIPLQTFFQAQANEALTHAMQVGEKITSFGGHPPVSIADVKEENNHTAEHLLRESLDFELKAIELYTKLSKLAVDNIALEEFARGFVKLETDDVDEIKKMLRTL